MQDYITGLLKTSRGKLRDWRLRYSAEVYAEKVAINTVYELLLLEAIWPWIDEFCFCGKQEFDSLEAAITFIADEEVLKYIGEVHPKVSQTFANRNRVLTLELNHYRGYVRRAVAGDQRALEVLEDSYSIHFASIYLLYSWAALGLMGVPREEALTSVASVRTSEVPTLGPAYDMMNMSVQLQMDRPWDVAAFALIMTIDLLPKNTTN